STPAAADAGVASTIDALIGRFVRALETRDLDRIKRIDAEADGTDRWWTFLSGPEVTDLRAEGRILSGPDVEGDEGSAVVEVTFHYRAGGAAATRPWPMRITFGRDADGWRIRTVRTLQ
ncbi:MAG: hypothetical protein IRZ00_13925, partial [Gemmatimonadetes bacterium]|nr:hypothetical protein [Gemmatimonadota bacterium]